MVYFFGNSLSMGCLPRPACSVASQLPVLQCVLFILASSLLSKCPWHEIFYYLVRKSFQNDEGWRWHYCDSTTSFPESLFFPSKEGKKRDHGNEVDGSTLGCRVIEYFDFVFYFVTSQQGHKVVWNHKKLNISHDFFCIELKLSTVVTLITKFYDMSTVTFPWQHNGLQALSSQRGKSEFSSFKKCYLLLLFIQ